MAPTMLICDRCRECYNIDAGDQCVCGMNYCYECNLYQTQNYGVFESGDTLINNDDGSEEIITEHNDGEGYIGRSMECTDCE